MIYSYGARVNGTTPVGPAFPCSERLYGLLRLGRLHAVPVLRYTEPTSIASIGFVGRGDGSIAYGCSLETRCMHRIKTTICPLRQHSLHARGNRDGNLHHVVQPLWVRTLWLMPEVLHPAKVTPLQLRAPSQKIPMAKHETRRHINRATIEPTSHSFTVNLPI